MKKILHLGVVGTAILTMTTTIACSAVDNRDEDNSYNNSDQIDKKLNDKQGKNISTLLELIGTNLSWCFSI